MKKHLSILSLIAIASVFNTSCSNSAIIENPGKCPSIQNTSNVIRSFSIKHNYKSSPPKSNVLTLKPGEIMLLECNGSISSKVSGSIKISSANYLQHKCSDSYNRPRNCTETNSRKTRRTR